VTPRSWSTHDMGDLSGTVALVTVANRGIGFATSRGLADHGAQVVSACRFISEELTGVRYALPSVP